MDKIYILNEKRYKQIEIELQQMDADKTIVFCVEEEKEAEFIRIAHELFFSCRFTVPEFMDELEEIGIRAFYMCSVFDDCIINELQ